MEHVTNLLDELHLSKEKSIQKVLEPDGEYFYRFLIKNIKRKNFAFMQCLQI